MLKSSFAIQSSLIGLFADVNHFTTRFTPESEGHEQVHIFRYFLTSSELDFFSAFTLVRSISAAVAKLGFSLFIKTFTTHANRCQLAHIPPTFSFSTSCVPSSYKEYSKSQKNFPFLPLSPTCLQIFRLNCHHKHNDSLRAGNAVSAMLFRQHTKFWTWTMGSDTWWQPWTVWFHERKEKRPSTSFAGFRQCVRSLHCQNNTVYNWLHSFKGVCQSTEDASRSGRPSTSTTEENIAVVERSITNNRRITHQELES